MSKELEFAFKMKEAPKELQDAATAHNENLVKLRKARKNLIDAKASVNDLEDATVKTEKTYLDELQKWDPEKKAKS